MDTLGVRHNTERKLKAWGKRDTTYRHLGEFEQSFRMLFAIMIVCFIAPPYKRQSASHL